MPNKISLKEATGFRPSLPLLAIAALAAVAGCGDSGDDATGASDATLTKAEVISQGGVICKQAEEGVSELPEAPTGDPFAKGSTAAEQQRARDFLAGYADLLESSRDGLQQLDAPEQDRELLDGYLDDIGAVVDQLRAASAADPEDVTAQADEAFAMFAQASRQTAEYGFPKGVCGSG